MDGQTDLNEWLAGFYSNAESLPEPHRTSFLKRADEARTLFEELEEQTLVDRMTGLFNERKLDLDVEAAKAKAKRYDNPFTYYVIDVDRFKEINDTHGHPTGDVVLRSIANLLKNELREHERQQVYRKGGDEFVLVHEKTNKAQAEGFVSRLLEFFSRFQGIDTYSHKEDKRVNIRPGLSIGFATYPIDTTDLSQLYGIADKNMYRAKEGKGDR
ncbi:MAG: GGDEF domain-containing protein [Nanoarchaeota archaeon]|nr:GGDEF domain-containing protein [Nanoarchaeota archaeon]